MRVLGGPLERLPQRVDRHPELRPEVPSRHGEPRDLPELDLSEGLVRLRGLGTRAEDVREVLLGCVELPAQVPHARAGEEEAALGHPQVGGLQGPREARLGPRPVAVAHRREGVDRRAEPLGPLLAPDARRARAVEEADDVLALLPLLRGLGRRRDGTAPRRRALDAGERQGLHEARQPGEALVEAGERHVRVDGGRAPHLGQSARLVAGEPPGPPGQRRGRGLRRGVGGGLCDEGGDAKERLLGPLPPLVGGEGAVVRGGLQAPEVLRQARPAGEDARDALGLSECLLGVGNPARGLLALGGGPRPPPPPPRGDEDGGDRGDHDGAVPRGLPPEALWARDGSREDRLPLEVAADVLGEIRGGRVAARGVLLHRLEADRLDVAMEVRVHGARRVGLATEHVGDDREDAVAHERRAAGEHLVQRRPEAVHVGARVDAGGVGADLLWGGVARRPQRRPLDGQACLARPRREGREVLGEAEVGDVGLSRGVDQDVGGLDVAMDDASRVGVVQGEGDLPGDLEGATGREALALGEVGEWEAVDEAHREVVDVAVLLGVVDLDDVGVLELRAGAGLPVEPLEELGGGVLPGDEDLEGDEASEGGLAGLVHDPHPSVGDLIDDLVAGVRAVPWRREVGRADQRGGLGAGEGGRVGDLLPRACLGEEGLALGGVDAAQADEEVWKRGGGPALLAQSDGNLEIALRGQGALADELEEERLLR